MTSINLDGLPAAGYVRLPQLIGERARQSKNKKKGTIAPPIPVCAATLWQWVADGRFPKPYKLGPRTTAWDVGEVREWLTACKREHSYHRWPRTSHER